MFIQLKNLQIGYDKPLITNINTYLKQGDVCLIIGNNGIGKTTLIKTLLRQIPILSGEIFINNKNLKKLSLDDISKLISIVFSKAEIPNNYTTNDLISFGKFTHYNYYIKLSQKDNQEIENIIKKLNVVVVDEKISGKTKYISGIYQIYSGPNQRYDTLRTYCNMG